MTDLEICRWFDKYAYESFLELNPFAGFSDGTEETAEEFLKDEPPECFLDPSDRQRCIDTNTVYEIMIYPVGETTSYYLYGTDVSAMLRSMILDMEIELRGRFGGELIEAEGRWDRVGSLRDDINSITANYLKLFS